MPNRGNVDCLFEHWPQKIWPQLRQWCFRCVNENATRHRWHTSPSDQAGAVSDVNIASASFNSGNLCPFVFKMVIVSCKFNRTQSGLVTQNVTFAHYMEKDRNYSAHTLTAWYLSSVRNTYAQAWINSNILAFTFSCVVFSISCANSSQFSLVAISSWMGEPQFFTILSSTRHP